jgi:hypothetical protein
LEIIPTSMRKILNDNALTAEVQISDINEFCWAAVQLAFLIKLAINDELSDMEGESK